MAKINLLPWREELRAELKKQFYTVLAGACFVGAGLVYVYDIKVQNDIAFQKTNNDYIVAEIKKLDESIKEIDGLKSQRTRLLERMEVIQNLQGNRSVIVHQFDELVRSVPDGVYFTLVEKKADKFSIEGIADANNRVSNLMRNLDKSDWFMNPNLASVTAKDEKNSETSASQFKLSFMEEKRPAPQANSPVSASPQPAAKP